MFQSLQRRFDTGYLIFQLELVSNTDAIAPSKSKVVLPPSSYGVSDSISESRKS